MTQKIQNPWTFDVRVRERNLRNGLIQEKEIEKYLKELPDVADQAEPFATAQPALEPPAAAEAADEGEAVAPALEAENNPPTE
jgi:hypothetical protein